MITKINKTKCSTDYISAHTGKTMTGHAWYADFTLDNGNSVSVWFPKSWTKKAIRIWIREMYGVEAV